MAMSDDAAARDNPTARRARPATHISSVLREAAIAEQAELLAAREGLHRAHQDLLRRAAAIGDQVAGVDRTLALLAQLLGGAQASPEALGAPPEVAVPAKPAGVSETLAAEEVPPLERAIAAVVGARWHIPPPEVFRPTFRSGKHRAAGGVAMHLLRYLGDRSYAEIGARFQVAADEVAAACKVAEELTLDDVYDDVEKAMSRPLRKTTRSDIIMREVCRAFRATPDQVIGRNRHSRVAPARHIAIRLRRDIEGLSYSHLGRLFGGRNHSTVMHACDAAEQLPQLAVLRSRAEQAIAEAASYGLLLQDTAAAGAPLPAPSRARLRHGLAAHQG
jgi:hypothetical protein